MFALAALPAKIGKVIIPRKMDHADGSSTFQEIRSDLERRTQLSKY